MESSWFILSILVTVSVWIVAFINKIFAKRKYDQRFSAIILYGIMFLFSIIYLLIFNEIEFIEIKSIILAIIRWVSICLYSLILMTVLRYLPTSTYFIVGRLSSSFVLLIIWILFFGDIISNQEILWLLIWIIAMILLFEKEKKEHLNYKKGIFFLLLWIFTLILGHTIAKVFSLEIKTVPTILAITFFSSFVSSIIIWYNTIKKNKHHFKIIFSINLIQSILYFLYFIVLFYVYRFWDLWISYKIQSYSTFIPIILSAIIYKEKITKKRFIAMLLTIASLRFFV